MASARLPLQRVTLAREPAEAAGVQRLDLKLASVSASAHVTDEEVQFLLAQRVEQAVGGIDERAQLQARRCRHQFDQQASEQAARERRTHAEGQ